MKDLENYKDMQSGFSTPDGYLDGIKDHLRTIPGHKTMEVLSSRHESEGFWRLIRPQLSLAASFVALIGLSFGLFYLFTQGAERQEVQEQVISDNGETKIELSNEKIIEYLSETDLDYYYLANN